MQRQDDDVMCDVRGAIGHVIKSEPRRDRSSNKKRDAFDFTTISRILGFHTLDCSHWSSYRDCYKMARTRWLLWSLHRSRLHRRTS